MHRSKTCNTISITKVAYSVEEASQASGLGRTILFAAIKSGALKSIKIGRRRLVPVEALTDFLKLG